MTRPSSRKDHAFSLFSRLVLIVLLPGIADVPTTTQAQDAPSQDTAAQTTATPNRVAASSASAERDASAAAGRNMALMDGAKLFDESESKTINQRLSVFFKEHNSAVTIVTLPGRPENFSMSDAAENLFQQIREASPMPNSKLWKNGILIAIDTRQRVSGIHAAEGWDFRDAERIRNANNSILGPLLRSGQDYSAIDRTLTRVMEIAKTRRELITSYWGFYVKTQKRHWRTLARELYELVTRPLSNRYTSLCLIMLGIFVWEWILPWRKEQKRFRDGFGIDLAYTIFSYLLFWGLFGTALCTVTAAIFNNVLYDVFRIENIVAVRLTMLPMWIRITLLILTAEFFSYWIHRLLHHNEWAWEFHKIHHSTPQIDVLNAARLHFGERLLYAFFPMCH